MGIDLSDLRMITPDMYKDGYSRCVELFGTEKANQLIRLVNEKLGGYLDNEPWFPKYEDLGGGLFDCD